MKYPRYLPETLAFLTLASLIVLNRFLPPTIFFFPPDYDFSFLGAVSTSVADTVIYAPDPLKARMSVIVSVLVLLTALFVILSEKYTATKEKWAYGSVGLILGFWLG